MIVRELRLKNYKTSQGRCPFEEWLASLDDAVTEARIDARLGRLRGGNFGLCGLVGEGVMELKLDFGPGYRVYFGRDGAELVILLCGGTKRGQDSGIKKAKEYWGDYKKRKKDE